MNCDQAFDALTSREASQNGTLADHLETCPRCCDMADVLSPALELFAPATLEEQATDSGKTNSSSIHRSTVPGSENADWVDTAPWRNSVQSARRARRDGLKIVGAVALVALLTVGFASLGRDGSQSGLLSPLAAAECIRKSPDPMTPETAVAACVSCHLQLADSQRDAPAQVNAKAAILKCVDCHMADDSDVRLASAKMECLFRPTGG